jgi:hypothetical protein
MFIRVLAVILCVLFFGCGEKDKIGTAIEEVGIYQTDGTPIKGKDSNKDYVIYRGSKVKFINDKECTPNDGSEKMVMIMMLNPSSDFVKGYQVCVPERKIKWE